MTAEAAKRTRKQFGFRRWIRRGFLVWAVVSTSWLANSFRTRGVDEAILRSSASVSVEDGATMLTFRPTSSGTTALVFICGGGVTAAAYAPLLRPIAEAGYPVFVIKLPYRFAPLASHKQEAVDRARRVIATNQQVSRWVVAGHSLGGALTARLAHEDPQAISAIVLLGTTHPRDHDLSSLQIHVTKIYASNDGVAPVDRVLANRGLLPPSTKWIEIAGGNHSQFGRYGHQLFDGTATISREAQETTTRAAILDTLARATAR